MNLPFKQISDSFYILKEHRHKTHEHTFKYSYKEVKEVCSFLFSVKYKDWKTQKLIKHNIEFFLVPEKDTLQCYNSLLGTKLTLFEGREFSTQQIKEAQKYALKKLKQNFSGSILILRIKEFAAKVGISPRYQVIKDIKNLHQA